MIRGGKTIFGLKKIGLSKTATNKTNILTSKQEGFSIVEMVIVVVVMGLLMIGVFQIGDIVPKARVNAITSELTQIQNAIASFKSVNEALPGDIASLQIKKQSESPITFTGFALGDSDGIIEWGVGTSTGTANESLLANAHLANAGYLDIPISYTASDFLLAAVGSEKNLIKSKKNPDLYYTIASIKSGTTDSIAFATPANPSINFNGNNIILGGISDASSSSVSLLANAANAGYFVNGSMFATKAPSIYVPTKPVLSLKIVTGLVENFGSVIKYCDEADKKIGECTTSELNVASLALVSL